MDICQNPGRNRFFSVRFRVGLLILFILLTCKFKLSAVVRHVGQGQTYTGISQAFAVVRPGDTLMIHSGTYAGGLYFGNLQGLSGKWIQISSAPGETVVVEGGSNAWQLSDAAYIQIRGIIFQRQTGNGFNLDDGGTYETPSQHILFEQCTFRDINATGNNDLLKLSGIDTFEIRNCTFVNGSPGGSGIDMVGCHEGLIIGNRFENQGSNSIQAKGGCRNIRIEANLIKNGGQRAINLGGSTGLPFFRPLDAKYEAAGLKVYSNVFIGSEAPVAYVGCIQSEVVNNTFYLPKKWVIRILQETVDGSRFYPCGNNSFRNNIVFRDNQVSTDCNIGPNTDPQSFTFSGNVWYHSQNQGWPGPALPVKEEKSLIGKDPLFVNPLSDDFSLSPSSPAIGWGGTTSQPVNDYTGNPFRSPRSAGAIEGGNLSFWNEKAEAGMILVNYSNGNLMIKGVTFPAKAKILDCNGKTVYQGVIEKHTTPLSFSRGIYFLKFEEFKEVYKFFVW